MGQNSILVLNFSSKMQILVQKFKFQFKNALSHIYTCFFHSLKAASALFKIRPERVECKNYESELKFDMLGQHDGTLLEISGNFVRL